MSYHVDMNRSPTYPLTKEQFRHAIKVGHGRTLIHARRFGVADMRDEILDAASRFGGYDAQVDGYKTEWLAPLCVEAGVVDEIIAQIPSKDDWRDRELRPHLLEEFALRGHERARQALYDECEMASEWGTSALFGARQIIQLDGEAGLVFLARKMGSLVNHPGILINEDFRWIFDAERGDGQAIEILSAYAARDELIATYLKRVSENEGQPVAGPADRVPHGEELESLIVQSDKELYLAHSWGREAQPDDIQRMLGVAVNFKEKQAIENALRYLSGAVRSRAAEPPMHPALFELVRHDSAMIRLQASYILSRHVIPEVRRAGLELLHADISTALDLLGLNAQTEDADAILRVLKPFDDDDVQHAVVSGLRDLFDNPLIREPQLGMYVYQYSPCMNCRCLAVKYLIRLDACPGWMREECRDDALEEIRELVA
jgi:hypothetical protein